MAAKGRNGKFDQRIKVWLDNEHNTDINSDLKSKNPALAFSDVVRACMAQAEDDFVSHPELIDMDLAGLVQEGLVSGERVQREIKAPEDFKEHFTLLCFRIGYDLNEYIAASLYRYLGMFVKRPNLMTSVALKWKHRNPPLGTPEANHSPRQTVLFGTPVDTPRNGK